jgi:uncharacterized repeat protein (TIGR01451 family)
LSALRLVLIALLPWLWALPSPVFAQADPIILTWQTITQSSDPLDPQGPTLPASALPTGAGITPVDLSRTGVRWNNVNNGFNSRDWPATFDPAFYLQWGFDASTPYILSHLTIVLQRSNTGPDDLRIDMSVDNQPFTTVHTGSLPSHNVLVSVPVNLGAVVVAGSVRFRLYGHGSTNASGTLRVQNDPPASPDIHQRGIVIRGRPALAELEAEKELTVFSEDGAGCGDLTASPPAEPENPAAIPGACVQYVINVTNSGPVAAQDVSLTDPIPVNLTLRTAELGPGWMAGTLGFTPDCTGTGCSVQITGGVIPAGTTATLAIRATVN